MERCIEYQLKTDTFTWFVQLVEMLIELPVCTDAVFCDITFWSLGYIAVTHCFQSLQWGKRCRKKAVSNTTLGPGSCQHIKGHLNRGRAELLREKEREWGVELLWIELQYESHAWTTVLGKKKFIKCTSSLLHKLQGIFGFGKEKQERSQYVVLFVWVIIKGHSIVCNLSYITFCKKKKENVRKSWTALNVELSTSLHD